MQKKSSAIRSTIVENIRLGKQPQSIKEMRQIEAERQKSAEQHTEERRIHDMTLSSVANDYLAGLNESTKKANTSRWNNHIQPVFGDTPLRKISPLDLERFKRDLQKKNLSPKTIHHCLTIIRTIFRKASSWGYFTGPIPTSKIDFPKINNKRLRFLSHSEADALLNNLATRSTKTHHQALIALHWRLRSGEVRGLKWMDVDFKAGVIHLPDTKTGESQQVFMTDDVREMLVDIVPEEVDLDAFIFPAEDGGHQYDVSPTFRRAVADLGQNDGITDTRYKVVFHTLRHTFCSWLAMQGTPLFTIQQLARHKTISQTERYSHLLPDHKQDAVKAMAAVFKQSRDKKRDLENINKLNG